VYSRSEASFGLSSAFYRKDLDSIGFLSWVLDSYINR
jgi:hypothetical protein